MERESGAAFIAVVTGLVFWIHRLHLSVPFCSAWALRAFMCSLGSHSSSLPHAAQSTLLYAETHTSSEGSGWMPSLALCHHRAQARVKDSRIQLCHQPMHPCSIRALQQDITYFCRGWGSDQNGSVTGQRTPISHNVKTIDRWIG